jgi:hypothetical protein
VLVDIGVECPLVRPLTDDEMVIERCDECQDCENVNDGDAANRAGYVGEWRECVNGGEHYIVPRKG